MTGNEQEQELLKALMDAFRVEAAEHLQAMSAGLIEIEKAAADLRLPMIESVYREAHSLKGAARAVNLREVEGICQSMEGVFSAWKRGERPATPQAFDAVHRSLDTLRALLSRGGGETSAPAPAEPPAGETVRVAAAKLDRLLREAEEMLAVKLAIGERAAELRDTLGLFEPWKHRWARLQPDLRSLRQSLERAGAPAGACAARLIEFCEWNHTQVRSIETRIEALAKAVQQNRHDAGRLVDELADDSKRLLMLPFATALEPLPRLVRDLGRDQGKQAELVVRGAEAEVDKRILEAMKDPLVHLVRNCVDHGIEPPEARARGGKPPQGTITIAVSEAEGNMVRVTVSDDGAGIDADAVIASAVRRGVVRAEDAGRLVPEAALALIFKSEVSTRASVTAISGRGLGLAIVREKVDDLGGRVTVETARGRGTTFTLLLPLTLAALRGVLVRVGEQVLAIPAASVERVVPARPGDIGTVENRETIRVDGSALSLARLGAVLGVEAGGREGAAPSVAVVLRADGQRIAFAADAVIGETEILVKPLPKPLLRVRNIAGAAVMGSGSAVPVLNVADLLRSAANAGAPPRPAGAANAAPRRRNVLVVEDSITSRMLLKNILESAGYRVRVAVDGIDAITALKTQAFDAVVSDIEMPRLNGFGLTERIRADRKLSHLPVVLVTALESDADRERGADAGANAYIVKSSFDQSNLLETMERLI